MTAILDFLINLPNPLPLDSSEADTRALVVDPLLSHAGWAPQEIKREPYAGWSDSRGFIDYLLWQDGRPMMVIEAKKVGRTFGLPQNLTTQRTTTYKKLRRLASDDLNEALDQCLKYSQHTGALYACATNGTDWIFFKPSHHFRALPDARIVIFNGIDQVIRRIDEFLNLFSSSGLQEGKAEHELLGREIQVPTHSKRLQDAFPYHEDPTLEEQEYSNILDQLLRHYIIELTDEVDFEECYLPVRSNRTTAQSLDELITGRIKTLRGQSQQTPDEFNEDILSKPLSPDLPSGRTVVLHGEVGVGKTSFLRHCEMELRTSGKLDIAVWARVDLLPFHDRQFSAEERNSMLSLICRTIQDEVSKSTSEMSGKFDPDEWDHLRDIYNSEVRKFQKARYPTANDNDFAFLEEARKYVWNLSQQDPQEHLIRVIRWLSVNCKLPVIVALDNADQLGLEFQEFLYKLSEKFKSSTSAVVILVMRTEALASHSIREHSIASVREQFLVHKAPLAQVLQKRFARVLSRVPQAYPGTSNKVARDRIGVLIETLGYEAQLGSDAFRLVGAAGNGSLRDNLRAISAIFKSSPAAMDHLVVEQHRDGQARLSCSSILRALMKDDLSNSDPTKLIPNVFNVDSQLMMPYSLGVRLLQQLRSKNTQVQYTVASLVNDLSLAGIDRTIVQRTLSRLRFDRFVEVAHMHSELREQDALVVTRLGEVLLDIILHETSYMSRTAFETYICDRQVYLDMRSAWTSGAGEYRKKFDAIGRLFSDLVVQDDSYLRQRIDLSVLEPVVNAPLPGVLAAASE